MSKGLVPQRFGASRRVANSQRNEPEPWMRFVKIMAILTPRGGPADRPRVHDPKRPLGEVLCNGGDPVGWPGSETLDPRPFISESRLARLLAQHPEKRAATLERFARMLAGRRDPQTGINCADIAALVLDSGNKSTLATLARHYYRRLDRASRRATQQETAA